MCKEAEVHYQIVYACSHSVTFHGECIERTEKKLSDLVGKLFKFQVRDPKCSETLKSFIALFKRSLFCQVLDLELQASVHNVTASLTAATSSVLVSVTAARLRSRQVPAALRTFQRPAYQSSGLYSIRDFRVSKLCFNFLSKWNKSHLVHPDYLNGTLNGPCLGALGEASWPQRVTSLSLQTKTLLSASSESQDSFFFLRFFVEFSHKKSSGWHVSGHQQGVKTF